MAPLPATVPTTFNAWPDSDAVQSAYDRCLREEQRLMESDQDPNTRWHLVCVRILGYLIHHAPTDNGTREAVKAINSHTEDAELHDLGGRYCQTWIRAFSESAKDQTPTPSDHSSPESEPEPDEVSDPLDPAPESHTKAKAVALIRDDYRCIVTRKLDRVKVASDPELIAKFESGELSVLGNIADTRCVHIFSESSNWSTSDEASTSDMWTAMRCFGYDSLTGDLNGVKVNRLENVMTLSTEMKNMFNSLSIWFVETASPHTYRIEATPSCDMFAKHYGPTVTFGITNNNLPRPSPTYLKIHAACAQVAHLSGASEWLREFDGNLDRHFRKTLANDGTSASLLYTMLWAHAMHNDVVA